MVFSSIPFLYYFLPCALALYFAVPRGKKNGALLFASLVFYGWGEPKFVLVMLLTILQGFLFGILVEKEKGRGISNGGIKSGGIENGRVKRGGINKQEGAITGGDRRAKVYLAVSAAIGLGLLGYCKYADFFIENVNAVTGLSLPLLHVTLPIGISFYTFQMLSYIVDVYRGEVPAQRNFVDLAAYIAMFPQLVAGPIVRYADISVQLKNRTHSFSKCALGIRRFILGLGKKVLIANTLGELCNIFKESNDKSVLFFWLYAVAYSLHIYFDFSGYSDMAIGLGKVFGFDFLENFQYPYISKSITEFWRRWHISLGSWFRDYVYIPLGGNRAGRLRWLRNLLVVWFLTGFWHGAAWNFIVWGLFFGALVIMEKLWLGKLLEKAGFFRHVYVMLFVILGFVLFDAPNMAEALFYIRSMFGGGGFPIFSVESLYYLRSYLVILLAAAVGSTPMVSLGIRKLGEREAFGKTLNIGEPIVLVLLMCLVTGYIVGGSFNPFLYFRF